MFCIVSSAVSLTRHGPLRVHKTARVTQAEIEIDTWA